MDDYDVPARVAFCEIFFGANGGQFDKKGRPIRSEGEDIRGMCDQPYDCGQCPFMAQWLTELMGRGWQVGWWCDGCARATAKEPRKLKAFYQSGRDPDQPITDKPYEGAPDFINDDPDKTPLKGCTRCGHQSSFLQLTLWGGPESDLLFVRKGV